ncbi:ribonuclease T2 family protein [Asaia bogorensis]|uniref:ribonuclease T2 family protein n=1 Tax=Asaia bogorensis TaxID=91915 RepID=UPI002863E78F|nr:ribonuclease I [Asaia bogorensis]MDR6182306.1 ribonuclease I [Asaia bogorensis NBRC 16594]
MIKLISASLGALWRSLSCLALGVMALGVTALGGCSTGPAPWPTALTPTRHADFDHNTLALTWQPGFCTVGKGCSADQPRQPLIGLHGLWASEPHSLEAQNIPVEHWWRDGCSLLEPDAQAPVLDNAMSATLSQIMPHTQPSLITHEWVKHGACFGYSAGPFFAKASALRERFAQSPMGTYLAERAGLRVRHDDLMAFFTTASQTTLPRALQLRCETDHEGRIVLTQLWFTLAPGKMHLFPAAGSYLASPQNQDNCPAEFWVKRW